MSPFFELDPLSDEQMLNCIRLKNVIYVHFSDLQNLMDTTKKISHISSKTK